MQAAIEAEIAEAQEFGTNSPTPSVDELRRDVFAEEISA
jgi:acetoin:2,6-dichlorophenolindophenol oxidoreductase subunit alpha